jgi:hypothetical protein
MKFDIKVGNRFIVASVATISFVAGGFAIPEARAVYRSIEGIKSQTCIDGICVGQDQIYATDKIGRKIGSTIGLSFVGCLDWSARVIAFPGFLSERCESNDYYYAFDREFDTIFFKFKNNKLVEISTRPRFHLTL